MKNFYLSAFCLVFAIICVAIEHPIAGVVSLLYSFVFGYFVIDKTFEYDEN